MHIQLNCSCRPTGFRAQASTAAPRVRALMAAAEAPYELAEADTFSGMVLATLVRRGAILCRDCGDSVSVSEVSRPAALQAVLA
jgi:hypothetical protein